MDVDPGLDAPHSARCRQSWHWKGNRVSSMQPPSFGKHLPCSCHMPDVLLTAGDTALIKIDDVPAVMEVEVETENKPENKCSNQIISDYDKCGDDNRAGCRERAMRVESGGYF
nr:uncharacterized protein LOC104653165 [Saimiri boliviensis boliviensis]